MNTLRQDVVVPEVEPIREAEFETAQLQDEPSSPEWLGYLRLLWEKRRVLYRTAVWALIASAIIAFLIPKHYESTATIMPPDALGGSSMMMAALASKASPGLASMAGNVLGMKSSGALFTDLLRSRTVQDNVVQKLNLQHIYWAHYKQDARKILDGRTGVSEDRKSGIITITAMDHDPQRAHDITYAYVDELNKLVAQVSTSSARRERMFIEQRLTSVKTDLEDAEKQFSVFASKNTALDIKEQGKAMVEAGAVLQGQMIAAQSELEGLQQIYTDGNVRVRAARARIEELRRQLQKMGGTDASLAPDAPASNDLYPSIRRLPLLGVQWADLYRRMKVQETVFELLSQQYEMARIQEAKEIPTVNIIDPANLPEKKSWPPRLFIMLGLTSLVLAVVVFEIVGEAKIQALDQDDPRRQFAMSAASSINQVRDRILANKIFLRFQKKSQSPDDGPG